MALPTTQNWDGVTAPALPSGWTFSNGTWTTTTGGFLSSPNGLVATFHAANVPSAMFDSVDDSGGDLTVETALYITSGSNNTQGYAGARASSKSSPTGGDMYYVGIRGGGSESGAFYLAKQVAGSGTDLGNVGSNLRDAWYKIQVSCTGTAIVGRCQRVSDSKWLDSGGSFVSGIQDAISKTDSSVTGAGYYGVFKYQLSGGEILWFDNFSATSNGMPADTFTLTGPTRGPAGSPSADYTVTPDGVTSATWTPNAQSGCTFTPSTLTLDDSTPKTFTVTRATAGSSTINGTASGLTPPASIGYEAVAFTTGRFAYQLGTPNTATTYQVFNEDNTAFQNAASAGTSSDKGSGSVSGVVIPADFAGYIQFTQGAVNVATTLEPSAGAANPLNGMLVTRG
jgi:hypothetical protein